MKPLLLFCLVLLLLDRMILLHHHHHHRQQKQKQKSAAGLQYQLLKSLRRYTITFAAYLCPPTWLTKYIPTPPGRSSSSSRYNPSGRKWRSNSRRNNGADCPQRTSRVRCEQSRITAEWGHGRERRGVRDLMSVFFVVSICGCSCSC